MIAGTLEIQLLANMARLQKDMDDAKRSVGGAMSDISRSVANAKAALGGLAAGLLGGLSVAGLVSVANRAIDAADAMNDLSQRVGIAVKDLAKYELAASQSGTTMESLAKGIKGLAGNLMEHGDALKKAGITATTADGAMKQLAEVFANMPDGMEKTTLAVKLFGKSGMDLIPMLNMGADGLEKTAEKSAKYAAQMAIMAPMADAYNDNMAEIAMSSKVVGMSIVNDMLPSMVSITGAMAMAAKESGILKAAWVGLGGAMDEFIAKPASVIFKGFNNTLDEANAKLMRFFGKTAESDKLLAAVARRNKEILDLTDDASAPASSASPSNGFDKAKWLADYKAMMDALGGGEKIKKVKEAAKEFKDLNEHVNEFAKANMKALEEDEKAREKYIEGLTKSADSIGEQVQKLRDEEQALGISTAQNISLAQALELVAIGRLHEEQAKQMSYGDEAAAAAIQTEIDKRRELIGLIGSKDAREANKKAVDELEKANQKAAEESEKFWTDALMRGFESGKSFFDNFWDTIKNKIKTDVLRVMVQPVAQGITGMMGLSGAANAAGTAGAASGIGTLGSVAAGVSAFGGTLATGFMNTLVGSGMSGGLTAAGAMIANGAWASGLGMAAGALGPIGLGIAALSMIGNRDKSTANTGNASARYDSAGNRTDYQTYYGGSSDGVDKMLASLQDSYTKSAQALGIAAAATEFRYGGNTGKNGESPNFALGGGAGSSKFYQGETASSDAAISLAASRAVFAALQGSDLPSYLAKVFNGVTADALSQEQITNTLAYAASLKQVRDALLETREPLQILKDNVAQGTAALSTSAETFKTDFVAALDSGITPENLAAWQALGMSLDQLKNAADESAKAVIEAAKNQTAWQQKLDIAIGKTTQREVDKAAALLAADDATDAIINSLYAFEDAATAATEAQRVALTALQSSTQNAITDMVTLWGDLTGAMAEINKPTATLVDQWRSGSEELITLTTGLAAALGELPEATALDNLKAALTSLASATAGIASLNSQIFDIKVGQGGQSAVDLLKGKEASLYAQMATSADPGAIAGQLATTTLNRIKLQGQLADKAINDAYKNQFDSATALAKLDKTNRDTQITALQKQISASQTLVDVVGNLKGYIAELKFGNLSALNPGDQLSAAQGLYSSTLADAQGGDAKAMQALQGNASSYLTEAQGYYGGATSQYAGIFQSVTGALEQYSQAPVTDITLMTSQLEQLQAIADSSAALQTVTTDTSNLQIEGLTSISTALTTREADLRKDAADAKQAAQAQIDELKKIVAVQEAQIRQHAAEYEVLNKKLEDIGKSLESLDNTSKQTAAAPA